MLTRPADQYYRLTLSAVDRAKFDSFFFSLVFCSFPTAGYQNPKNISDAINFKTDDNHKVRINFQSVSVYGKMRSRPSCAYI